MGRKNFNQFIKRQKAEKKRKKKEDKRQKKEQRRGEVSSGNLADMMAYVDEFGNIVDEPQEEIKEEKKDSKDSKDSKKAKKSQ